MITTAAAKVLLAAGVVVGPPAADPAPSAGSPAVQPTSAPASPGPAAETSTPPAGLMTPADAPAWMLRRVAGDLDVTITRHEWGFSAGVCRITTPLPVGYPDPTPPGAIDLKRYPSVRRAEVDGSNSPDRGMNGGFWPLFRHISSRNIEMTSPVEMDYHALAESPAGGGADRGASGDQRDDDAAGEQSRPGWTMSFLYRTTSDGGLEAGDRVRVIDTQPTTVVSIGMRGDYTQRNVRAGLAELEKWLSSQSAWVQAGPPRALFYNGPDVPRRNAWLEVQIPVRLGGLPAVIAAPEGAGVGPEAGGGDAGEADRPKDPV